MESEMTASADPEATGITRRKLIERGAAAGLLVGGASVLAACGSGSGGASTSSVVPGVSTTSGGGTPVRGGTMTVGVVGAGPAETLNPVATATSGDFMRALQLFEPLFSMSEDLQSYHPHLAVSAEPNADASVWTVKLRDGVTWHDGSPLTADDVIYSFNFWVSPASFFAGIGSMIDVKKVKKLDRLTVQVPLVAPSGQWPSTTTIVPVVKAGTKAESFNTNPIGTGPFKFVSFNPSRSVFTANKDYWQQGKPYVDRLVFDTSFTDENARLNALLSNQIDVMPIAPFLQARNQLKAGNVTVVGSPSPWTYPFAMRVDRGPLADKRVRQAMKLIADRQGLIDGAWAGFGTVGNDLLGYGEQYFASDLRRTQDIEQARSLLKAAGAAGSTFTLQTSAIASGVTEAATLFAQQASAAGIKVKVQQISPASYYTPAGGFMSGSFRSSYYSPNGSLTTYYVVAMSQQSAVNETYWGHQPGGKAAWKLIDEAVAATDAGRARDLWHQVQQQQFDEGGFLVWGNNYSLNLVSKKVKGLRESPIGYLNDSRLLNGWIAA